MMAHLQKEHRIANEAILKQKVGDNRIGRDHQVRFWCGFCGENVGLKHAGVKGWDERFNHIDLHFKAGKKILEWIDAESNLSKKEMEKDMEWAEQQAANKGREKMNSAQQRRREGAPSADPVVPVPQPSSLSSGKRPYPEHVETNSESYIFCVSYIFSVLHCYCVWDRIGTKVD
jgi:hypothetical protein